MGTLTKIGYNFDGKEEDYIEIPNKWHFKIETTTPTGHNVIIDFGEKILIVDGEIYFTTESCNYYPIALSPDEILSDYYQEEKDITLRWTRKNEGHLKLKKKTDLIVVDWKNIRYWINGMMSKCLLFH